MTALATLLQPVIRARYPHAIDAIRKSFRGRRVLTGLVRRTDSATTGTGSVV